MTQLKRRGFTLLELVVGAVIMAIVGGFGLFSLSQGHSSTQSRGLAEEIAEELKAARQQAISRQQPVALVFPSANRGSGKSQAFYQLEGIAKPQVMRAMNYADTYPESCFFWGRWGSGAPEAPAASVNGSFSLASWGALPNASDYVLVFTPRGTVESNGLALYDGSEYRLLTSNGVAETGGAPLLSPSTVSKPYTVRISKAGGISVSPGVLGATIPEGPSIAMGSMAAVIPPVASGASGPSIRRMTAEPLPVEVPESGCVTVVPQEGYITLKVDADEAGTGPLTVQWQGQGPAGEGMFSSKGPVQMTWDPRTVDPQTKKPRVPCWTAQTTWTPPADATPGQQYDLKCKVTNPQNQQVEGHLGTAASVEVVRPHRIASISTDENWENPYVAWMNPEGTNVINVTVPDKEAEQLTPVWDPNGGKLAFYSGKYLDPQYDNFRATLYIVNNDGANMRSIFTCEGDTMDYKFGPSFAPDGARVAFSGFLNWNENDDNYNSRVYVCRMSGAIDAEDQVSQVTFTNPAPGHVIDHSDVSWHPTDERYVLYSSHEYSIDPDVDHESGIYVCRVQPIPANAAASQILEIDSRPNGNAGEAHWSFLGGRIVYTFGGKVYLRYFHAAKTTPPTPWSVTPAASSSAPDITPPGVTDCAYPRFSSDEAQVAVIGDYSDKCDLWVISLSDGNSAVKVFSGVDGFNWSPDGEELVVTDQESRIWVVAADGSSRRNVTPPGFSAYSTPSWFSPGP